jgi:hypothetical protein
MGGKKLRKSSQETEFRIQNSTTGSQPKLAIFIQGENLSPVSVPARFYQRFARQEGKLP